MVVVHHSLLHLLSILFITDAALSAQGHCNQSGIPCGCARYTPRNHLRIVDGEPTQTHDWPMIVSLRYHLHQATHFCAGTILSESFVLTAAHCVDLYGNDELQRNRLTIAAGSHNRSATNMIIRQIDRIIIHPEWIVGSKDFRYDIALLHMKVPLNFKESPWVLPTCLPSETTNIDEIMHYPSNGTALTVIGWGRLDTYGSFPDILHQANVYAMDHQDRICANSIYDPTLQFCAGLYEGGRGTCYGDSGGPILRWIGDRWEQVGIISYSKANCAVPGFPNVYTRLAYFTSWINTSIHTILETTPSTMTTGIYRCKRPHPSCGCGQEDVILFPSTTTITRNALDYTWPMLVFIRVDIQDGHVCTGSIISESLVLTAAHCFTSASPSGVTVAAGVTNRSDPTQIIRSVDRLHFHPLYNASPRDYRHDIALLHLHHRLPFEQNPRLRRSCVHPSNSSTFTDEYLKNGTQLAIIGWGALRFGVPIVPEMLQQAEVYSIGHEDNKLPLYGGSFGIEQVMDAGSGIFRWMGDYWLQIGIALSPSIEHGMNTSHAYVPLSYHYAWMNSIADRYGESIEIRPTWETPDQTTRMPQQTIYRCQPSRNSCGCSMSPVVITDDASQSLSTEFGRENASPLSWSMVVSIRVNSPHHNCVGTILSDSMILTSARCVFNFDDHRNITIVAGVHKLSDSGTLERSVDRVHLHPEYVPEQSCRHDVALVHLHDPLPIDSLPSSLVPVCVPDHRSPSLNDIVMMDMALVAVGWDSSGIDGGEKDTLQQRRIRLIPDTNPSCSNVSLSSDYQFCGHSISFSQSVVWNSSCHVQHDAGTPVFLYRKTHWEQVGVVVGDNRCHGKDQVRLYTRLLSYTTWMRTVLNESLPTYPVSAAERVHSPSVTVFLILWMYSFIDS